MIAKKQIWRIHSQYADKRRPSATDVVDHVNPETALIVGPTGPGSPVVSVDTALGLAGLCNGLKDDVHVANVGGCASRLSTAYVDLASTVVDPEVIASDLAGGRRNEHGHDLDGDSTDGDSTVNSDNSSDLAAFVKAVIGDFGGAAGNVAAVASTYARRLPFGTADEEFMFSPTSVGCGPRSFCNVDTVGCRRVRDACCRFRPGRSTTETIGGPGARPSNDYFRDRAPLRSRWTGV